MAEATKAYEAFQIRRVNFDDGTPGGVFYNTDLF